MAKRATVKLFEEDPIPDLVKDETVTVPRGETRYTIDLTDDMVELMAQGICPQPVATRCYEMLSWKREHYRNEARERTTTM